MPRKRVDDSQSEGHYSSDGFEDPVPKSRAAEVKRRAEEGVAGERAEKKEVPVERAEKKEEKKIVAPKIIPQTQGGKAPRAVWRARARGKGGVRGHSRGRSRSTSRGRTRSTRKGDEDEDYVPPGTPTPSSSSGEDLKPKEDLLAELMADSSSSEANSNGGRDPATPTYEYERESLGESYCHVEDCDMAKRHANGRHTARKHHCDGCNRSVHGYCCEIILGMPQKDENDPKLCTDCFDAKKRAGKDDKKKVTEDERNAGPEKAEGTDDVQEDEEEVEIVKTQAPEKPGEEKSSLFPDAGADAAIARVKAALTTKAALKSDERTPRETVAERLRRFDREKPKTAAERKLREQEERELQDEEFAPGGGQATLQYALDQWEMHSDERKRERAEKEAAVKAEEARLEARTKAILDAEEDGKKKVTFDLPKIKKPRYTTQRMTTGVKKKVKKAGRTVEASTDVPDGDVEMTDAMSISNRDAMSTSNVDAMSISIRDGAGVENENMDTTEVARTDVRKEDLMIPRVDGYHRYKVLYDVVDRAEFASLECCLPEDETKRLRIMYDSIEMKHFQIRSDLASYSPMGPCETPGHQAAVDAIRGTPATEGSRPKQIDWHCSKELPIASKITSIPGVEWDAVPRRASNADFNSLITSVPNVEMKPDVFRWKQSVLVHGVEKVKENWSLFCEKGVIFKVPRSIYCDRSFVRSPEGIYYLSSVESMLRDLLSKDVSDIPVEKLISFSNLPLRTAVDFGPLKWWWAPRANRAWLYEKMMKRSLNLHLPFDGHDASHLPLPDLAHYFKEVDENDRKLSFPEIFNDIPTFVSYYYGSQLSSTVGLPRTHLRRALLERMHELEAVIALVLSYYHNWVENGRAFVLPNAIVDIIDASGIADVNFLQFELKVPISDVILMMKEAAYYDGTYRNSIESQGLGGLSTSYYYWCYLDGSIMKSVNKRDGYFCWETNVPFPIMTKREKNKAQELKENRRRTNRGNARRRNEGNYRYGRSYRDRRRDNLPRADEYYRTAPRADEYYDRNVARADEHYDRSTPRADQYYDRTLQQNYVRQPYTSAGYNERQDEYDPFYEADPYPEFRHLTWKIKSRGYKGDPGSESRSKRVREHLQAIGKVDEDGDVIPPSVSTAEKMETSDAHSGHPATVPLDSETTQHPSPAPTVHPDELSESRPQPNINKNERTMSDPDKITTDAEEKAAVRERQRREERKRAEKLQKDLDALKAKMEQDAADEKKERNERANKKAEEKAEEQEKKHGGAQAGGPPKDREEYVRDVEAKKLQEKEDERLARQLEADQDAAERALKKKRLIREEAARAASGRDYRQGAAARNPLDVSIRESIRESLDVASKRFAGEMKEMATQMNENMTAMTTLLQRLAERPPSRTNERRLSPASPSLGFAPRSRSRSPVRRRGGSPVHRRDDSPVRRRGESPVRRRDDSPVRRRGESPRRRRSRSRSPADYPSRKRRRSEEEGGSRRYR